MTTITLCRDDDTDIQFSGALVASVSSRLPNGPRSIRWTEIALYRVDDGRYVVHEIGHTTQADERTRYSAYICDDERDVIDALGYGWLSKQLYQKASIQVVERI